MGPNCNDLNILGPWAWDKMKCMLWTDLGKSGMGHVTEEGEVKWAAIYDHYEEGGSIQIHTAIADPKYVSRQAIYAIFEYPFNDLGVKKLIAIVNSENAKAMSLDLRLGFRIEAIIKDVYDIGDMYILSMTPKECHWLRGIEHGKRKRAA